MEKPRYLLTHYVCRSPYGGGWITTDFITRLTGKEEHCWGFSNKIVDLQKIQWEEENGSIQKLPQETPITTNQGVWITPEQKVYIADSKNPSKGAKIFVYEDNIISFYEAIEEIFELVIDNSNYIKNPVNLLRPYINNFQWKSLIDIFVRKVKIPNYTEIVVNQLGIILIDCEQKYPEEFQKMMLEFGIRIFQGKINFVDNQGKIVRHELLLPEDTPLSSYANHKYDIAVRTEENITNQ